MRVLLHTGNSSAYRCLEKINRLDPEIRVSVGSRPTNSLDADVVAIPGTASHRPAADIMPGQRACEKKDQRDRSWNVFLACPRATAE
jgi:hypothetical protein